MPAPVRKLRSYGMSPPLAAATPTLDAKEGDASSNTGPRRSMSPGMSQNGTRSPSRSPVRAGTRGNRLVLPSPLHDEPSQRSSCEVAISSPTSAKASPVPTEPVTPSIPKPTRAPTETDPAPRVPELPGPPQAGPPAMEAKTPPKGPSSSRKRGRWTSPDPRPGTGIVESPSQKEIGRSPPWLGGWRSSVHELKANMAENPGPKEPAPAASASPGRSAWTSC